MALLEFREGGFYCAAGDFWIDPWIPVKRAIVTHAHSDHALPGSDAYLTARTGVGVLRARVGGDAAVEALEYGERVHLGEVAVSLHPAGHILGSAQVRLESRGEVWVVSGDYKLESDATCVPFEPLRCHTFVTESTFGLPIFRWPKPTEVMASIEAWWRGNQAAGKASVLFAYPLGKAQRILAAISGADGAIYTHGSVERMNTLYRREGVRLAETRPVVEAPGKTDWQKALILAPPDAIGSPWMRRFGSYSTAFASGWMRIRGTRRRRALDRGFVMSDHADWPGLLEAIAATGAESVCVTHGYRAPLVRWLGEHGLRAFAVQGQYSGDTADQTAEEMA